MSKIFDKVRVTRSSSYLIKEEFFVDFADFGKTSQTSTQSNSRVFFLL